MPPAPQPIPDAREVDRVDAIVTVVDPALAEVFLDRCFPRFDMDSTHPHRRGFGHRPEPRAARHVR